MISIMAADDLTMMKGARASAGMILTSKYWQLTKDSVIQTLPLTSFNSLHDSLTYM